MQKSKIAPHRTPKWLFNQKCKKKKKKSSTSKSDNMCFAHCKIGIRRSTAIPVTKKNISANSLNLEKSSFCQKDENHTFSPKSPVRTKFPNRQHFPNGQCYAELGNTTFWNSSEFSNLNGFSFVVSLLVLWECFSLHHLSFISFKKFWPCEIKFDSVVSI